jgi:hypothetical protein
LLSWFVQRLRSAASSWFGALKTSLTPLAEDVAHSYRAWLG